MKFSLLLCIEAHFGDLQDENISEGISVLMAGISVTIEKNQVISVFCCDYTYNSHLTSIPQYHAALELLNLYPAPKYV